MRSKIVSVLSLAITRQISALEKLGLVNENVWEDSVLLEFEYLCHLYMDIVGPLVLSGYEKVFRISLDNFFKSESLIKWATNCRCRVKINDDQRDDL